MNLRPVLIALFAFAAELRAQTTLATFNGGSSGDRRGHAIAGGEDFDGDGYDDLVVGTPEADTNGKTNNGTVRIYSGQTGLPFNTKSGNDSDDLFGTAVAIVGDVDNDGVRDVLAGAPGGKNGVGSRTGLARVFSGASGTTLFTIYGSVTDDTFGSTVDGGIDSDGDNVPDFMVGAPNGINPGSFAQGYVRTFSGASGAQLLELQGTGAGDRLGTSLCALGDINNDNQRDFAVGAPRWSTSRGRVWIYSGDSVAGSVTTLATLSGAVNGDYFGAWIAGGLDANGDNFGDILIGAEYANVGTDDTGAAYLFAGPAGTLMHSWFGDDDLDRFGGCVASIRKVNGNSGRDVLIGAPGGNYARVFDSQTGEALLTVQGQFVLEDFGYALADAGDFDNDGVGDFAVGAPLALVSGVPEVGYARVFSSRPWAAVYCSAGTSTNGCIASVSVSGSPSAGATSGFFLNAVSMEGQKNALFFYGLSGRIADPWGAGTSTLCVKAPTQRAVNGNSGGSAGGCDGALSLDWLAYLAANPNALGNPFSAGQVVNAQCWYRDPPSSKTTGLSNAVEFVVVP